MAARRGMAASVARPGVSAIAGSRRRLRREWPSIRSVPPNLSPLSKSAAHLPGRVGRVGTRLESRLDSTIAVPWQGQTWAISSGNRSTEREETMSAMSKDPMNCPRIVSDGRPITSLDGWELPAPPQSPNQWLGGRSAKEAARA